MQLLNIFGCILLAGCLSINTVKALRCHTCGPENQNNCKGPIISIDGADKCPNLDKQCFTLKFEDNIIRGCESKIPEECILEPKECGIEYCDGSACNKDTYPKPAPTLKCYQCVGEECKSTDEISTKLCINYMKDDSCYSYIDSKNIVSRGCISDDNEPCRDVKCDKCKTNGCNGKIYKPQPTLRCYKCKGESCKSTTEITPQLCTNYIEEDSCYFYLDREKNVYRGCTSDNDAPCQDNECDTCGTPGCNDEIYKDKPALKCYKCNGEGCQSTVGITTQLCENYIENDSCYSYLDSRKMVWRGCTSDDYVPCRGTDCDTCDKSGCNRNTYKVEPKLKCFQCSGEDCSTVFQNPPKLCDNYDKQCYTYIDNDKNVFRGCVSENNSPCTKNNFCVRCDGDGCNKDPETIKYSCNVCKANSKSCMGELGRKADCSVSAQQDCTVLLGRPQSCFTYHEIGKFERGCGQNPSENYYKKFLETCNRENCNSQCVTNCYECQSNSDPNCKNQLSKVTQTSCFNTNYCHECQDERGIVTRGCKKMEDEKCNSCNGNQCNEKTPISCKTCTSKNETACINDISKVKSAACRSILDVCVSKIIEGYTIRRCDKPCADNLSTDCKSCPSNNCNTELIPAERVFCHKCDNDKGCPKEQTNEPKPCQLYSYEKNECFSVQIKDRVIRGCKSDKEHAICDKNNKCHYCSNPLGCNSEVAESSFKCVICNDETECGYAQDSAEAKECKFEFRKPACFTRTFANNKVERGCLTKDECSDLDEKNGKCFTCDTESCNTKSVIEQMCIECDSTKDKNCVDGKDITPTICGGKPTYFKNRGCYTMKDGEKILRGCASALTDQDFQACASTDFKYCNLCTKAECNTDKAPTVSKPPSKCIECNDKEQCPWGYTTDKAKQCDSSKCFRYQFDNGTVTRGCGGSEFECDAKDEKCLICNDDACNNKNVVSNECYQCKSDKKDEKTCADTAQDIKPTKCPDLQTYEKRGCYTKTENKIVTRGCSVGLNDKDLADCNADKDHKKCDICTEDKCNNKKAPNSASLLTHFSFVSLIIISAFITFKN